MKMDKIAAFDTLYTNNHIQILKLLIPSLPKDKQYFGVIFIKFLELKYVIEFGKNIKPNYDSCSDGKTDYGMLCNDILPFCSEKEAKTVESIKNMIHTFETFKSMAPMLEMLQQMGNMQSEDNNSFDFSSLMNMGNLFSDNMDFDMLKTVAGSFMGGDNGEIFDNLYSSFLQNESDNGKESDDGKKS